MGIQRRRIVELAGFGKETVKTYLRDLKQLGYVEHNGKQGAGSEWRPTVDVLRFFADESNG